MLGGGREEEGTMAAGGVGLGHGAMLTLCCSASSVRLCAHGRACVCPRPSAPRPPPPLSCCAPSLRPCTGACGVSAWFLTTGFSLMFAPVVAKSLRLWIIFTHHKLKTVTIHDAKLGSGALHAQGHQGRARECDEGCMRHAVSACVVRR